MNIKNDLDKVVLTIATGKPVYIKMAVNLARSFKIWHHDSSIKFVLVTDQKHLLPSDLDDLFVVEINPGEYGKGFSTKLYLDQLTPARKTVFVDADCLCVGSMESVFERFSGHSVSVVGQSITGGEWFGNISEILLQFSLSTMPRFNGGLYYLEKSAATRKIYQTARELEARYDAIGFLRLRGQPNDEVLMSLAMAIHGQRPISEDGSIMNSTLAAPGGVEIDVFSGHSKLSNPYFHPNYNAWYKEEEMRPILVHFISSETEKIPYLVEQKKLDLVCSSGWPKWLAILWSTVSVSIPQKIVEVVKSILRPAYHMLFGVRAVKASLRI